MNATAAMPAIPRTRPSGRGAFTGRPRLRASGIAMAIIVALSSMAHAASDTSYLLHGDTTRWLRDAATGLVTNKVYADGSSVSYDYTPDGKIASRTWARGVVTTYSYDRNGSLTNVVYSDGTPSVSYVYSPRGTLLAAIVDGVSTNRFAYDVFGQMTNEVQNDVMIIRTFDRCGRPTGYALGGFAPSREVHYSYDTLGRFTSVTASAQPSTFNRSTFQPFNFTYTYLPSTDLVSGYTCGDFARSVSYEPQRNLISAVTNSFGSSLISAFDYANDQAGRRVLRYDTFDGAVTTNLFGYNLRSEVISALMGTNTYGYAYDPIGNRIEAFHNAETNAYVANSLNQYTAISNLCASAPLREPTYDADGNMTSDGSGWRYAWNGENRMVMASNDTVVVTYAYDHRGRMVRKDIQRRGTEPQSIHYTWDNWNIIRETLVTRHSSLVTDNVWGLDLDGTLQGAGGVGGLLAVIRPETVATNSSLVTRHSSLYFPAYDANGNITEYVDASDGDVVAHYEYSPFGEQLVASGDLAATFEHRFSTKPWCADTGLDEYVYRKYRPDKGRWTSRDPIGESGGLNIYAMIGNDTVSKSDILGLDVGSSGKRKTGPCDCGDTELNAAALRAINAGIKEMHKANDGHERCGFLCCNRLTGIVSFTMVVGRTWHSRYWHSGLNQYVTQNVEHCDPESAPECSSLGEGFELAGYFHSHVKGTNFSSNDFDWVRNKDFPFFVGIGGDTGRRLDPTDKPSPPGVIYPPRIPDNPIETVIPWGN